VHGRWVYILDEWDSCACGVHIGIVWSEGGFDHRPGDPWIHYAASQSEPASGGKQHLLRSDLRRGFRRAGGRMIMSATFCRCMQSDCCCCRRLPLLFANALIFHLVGKRLGKPCNIPGWLKMFSRTLFHRESFVRNYAYLLARC